jgi:hypothetical protein
MRWLATALSVAAVFILISAMLRVPGTTLSAEPQSSTSATGSALASAVDSQPAPATNSEPQPKTQPLQLPPLRIVAVSDLHGLHNAPDKLAIPATGDILLCAGDVELRGRSHWHHFLAWMAALPQQ